MGKQLRSLDQFVQHAGLAAFGRNAIVFVWIAMAYASLVGILLSFAVTSIMYDPSDATLLFEFNESSKPCVSSSSSSSQLTTLTKTSLPPPLNSQVHYLGEDSFYASTDGK